MNKIFWRFYRMRMELKEARVFSGNLIDYWPGEIFVRLIGNRTTRKKNKEFRMTSKIRDIVKAWEKSDNSIDSMVEELEELFVEIEPNQEQTFNAFKQAWFENLQHAVSVCGEAKAREGGPHTFYLWQAAKEACEWWDSKVRNDKP